MTDKFSVSYLVEVDVGAEVDSPALTCRGATLFHALLTSEMVGVVPRYINLFITCTHLDLIWNLMNPRFLVPFQVRTGLES